MAMSFFIGGCAAVLIFSGAGCSMQRKPEAARPAAQSQMLVSPVASIPVPPVQEENNSVWDFGRVTAGQIMKHDFTLINDSPIPLAISAINTSCGCTVPEVKKKLLSPGESTLIEVTFNSTGYSGLIEQYVYVHTDRRDNPILKFTIKADVVK